MVFGPIFWYSLLFTRKEGRRKEGSKKEGKKKEGRGREEDIISIKFLPIILLLAFSFKNVTLLFSDYHLQSLQCLCLRGYANFLLDTNHLISDFRKST